MLRYNLVYIQCIQEWVSGKHIKRQNFVNSLRKFFALCTGPGPTLVGALPCAVLYTFEQIAERTQLRINNSNHHHFHHDNHHYQDHHHHNDHHRYHHNFHNDTIWDMINHTMIIITIKIIMKNFIMIIMMTIL